ncbi:hypothetical protein PENSPDRAFT_749087 [Peniophora sp. CONT]|nr:hypothetical protein PENSPDRAFT_749087 [Peniophora sp. CONT]
MVQLTRALLSLGLLASASAQKPWKVVVGNETGGALFDPVSLDGVASGDTITFIFSPKNHSVTQSSFAEPCQPLPNGFDTGFAHPVAIGAPLADRPTFTYTMNGTGPLWIYCRQGQFTPQSHCGQDMVFAINPDQPGTGANRTLDTFRKNAIAEAWTDLLYGNVTTTNTTSANATATTASTSVAQSTQSGYYTPEADSLAAAVSDDSSSGDSHALLDKLDSLTPVVFGLLGGILVILLAILGVGITMCVRRGTARQSSPSYAPVGRQDRVDFPESERYTDGALKYSDA